MKKQSIGLLTQISTKELRNLTSIVKETSATGFIHLKNKVFTASDLWNIQRQGKSKTQRRFYI